MSPSAAKHDAWIGLGSNLDDPAAQVRSALTALDALPGTRVQGCSSLYRSAPWGYAEQPDFVNAVARLTTELAARELLDELLAVERRYGRVRAEVNGPRVLDLDLLLYDDASIDEPGLVVPHPRMHERAFVLVPMLELDALVRVPGRGAAAQLVRELDTGGLERLDHA